MNHLLSGISLIVLGTIMIPMDKRRSRAEKENDRFEIPYLRNGGIGMILFGLYNLMSLL